MNEKELIEETVGGNIKRIKKELVHILVDDEEIKSLIINECVDILNERLIEKLEDIKEEIENLLSSYGYLDMHTNNDVLEIIDNHISELKGENNDIIRNTK